MRLRIARSATVDLDEIWIYVARGCGVEAAEHLVSLLMSRFETIVRHPGLGRNRAGLGESIRSLVVGSYRIYYRQERKGIVRILYVKHAARNEAQFFGQK